MRLGFDGSEFNTQIKSIPWRTVEFGCIRLTSGLNLDTLAHEHLRRASGDGVADLVGYGYLKGNVSGEAQADCLLNRALTLEASEHLGPLALAFDIEDPLKGPPWHRPTYSRILREAVEYLDEHARLRRPGLYTSPGFVAQLDMGASVRACWLWLADWTPPADLPVGWSRWEIWQHKVAEVAPGVPIDHNLHDGTAEDWRARLFRPDPHDELGGLVTTIQEASGHGPGGVEDFRDVREGPRFDR